MECAHPPCTCMAQGDGFCSEHCRTHGQHADGGAEHACECGHPACAVPSPSV